MAEKAHFPRLNKEAPSTEVWFDRNPDNLPEFQLSPLSSNVFASYSGPDCGLAFVYNLEAASTTDQCSGTKNKGHLIAGCSKWNVRNRKAYGISMSLYDQHPVNGKITGDPIADCFGLCARENSALIVAADGVNWGEKPRLAARCAVYGAIKHINERLFQGITTSRDSNKTAEQGGNHETILTSDAEFDETNDGNKIAADFTDGKIGDLNPTAAYGFGSGFGGNEIKEITTTRDVFKLLLSSFKEAHKTILKHDGGLTTLCACLVCPISDPPDDISSQTPSESIPACSDERISSSSKKFAVCVVNVGDSLAFVFGRRHGVREITTGSHDVTLERNIRDAGGALGPVGYGGEPELHNLTCSITRVEAGDVIFLATDGITDNFDPVVTKVAVAKKLDDPKTPLEANVDILTDSAVDKNVQLDNKENISLEHNLVSDNLKSRIIQTTETFDETKEQSGENLVQCGNNLKNDTFIDKEIDKEEVTSEDVLKDTSIVDNNENSLDMNIDKISSSEILPEVSNLSVNEGTNCKQPSATSQDSCTEGNKIVDRQLEPGRRSPDENKQSSSGINTTRDEYEDSNRAGNVSKKEDVLGLKDGKPVMLPYERHRYAIKEMERVIHEFELYTECPCSAQELCGALLQHVLKLTDPRRKVLENPDLYGKKKRLKAEERQNRDSEIVSKLAQSPGKLDHATVIGYEVGCFHGNEDEDYCSNAV